MRLILVILFLLVQGSVNATLQVSNTIRFNGSTYNILSVDPLEAILEAREINTDTLRLKGGSTGCYRGYTAEFLVQGDRLYLEKVTSCTDSNAILNLAKVFPQEYADGKVWAWWFTGSLNLGKTSKVIASYWINYDEEIDLFIESGRLTKALFYDNSKTRPAVHYPRPASSLEKFYLSELPEHILKRIKEVVSFSIENDENGKLHVALFDERFAKVPSDVRAAILQVTALIPNWPIVYKKGKLYPVKGSVRLEPGSKKPKIKRDKVGGEFWLPYQFF